MSTKTVSDFLEFANLQIAAEAFYELIKSPANWQTEDYGNIKYGNLIQKNLLIDGNEHASKFTETLAQEFMGKWEMLAHIANTGAGFSGSLFRARHDIAGTAIKAGELVLSFRSTEFIEDAVRDNRATNTLEIKEKGFAFGQIADMERWAA